MEKQVFELFMRLRFPNCKTTEYYYKEWKDRFQENPVGYMDYESMGVFKDVINILYLNSIREHLKNK